MGERLVVEHLPGAVRVVEAGDGPSQASVVSQAARGSKEGSALARELGHLNSVS